MTRTNPTIPGITPAGSEDPGYHEHLALALEAAPTGMLMVDRSGKILLVNEQIEKIFGYARNELVGEPIEKLVPHSVRDRHPALRRRFFKHPEARPMGAGRELFGVRKDGTEVPVEIGLNPLRTRQGFYVLSSVVDITERRRVEREKEELLIRLRDLTSELSENLEEREVLLQEIHHRVKNNLQVISSIINMQVEKLPDDTTRDALIECQTRVLSIALIHEQLYQAGDYAHVPFAEYARDLAANVLQATGVALDTIALQLDIDDIALTVDRAIPCGLILNELMTNALQHAFPTGRRGTIRAEFKKLPENSFQLRVTDDGVGLPEGLDIHRTDSLGLLLVTNLAEQLDGQLSVTSNDGAAFEVTFPASER